MVYRIIIFTNFTTCDDDFIKLMAEYNASQFRLIKSSGDGDKLEENGFLITNRKRQEKLLIGNAKEDMIAKRDYIR